MNATQESHFDRDYYAFIGTGFAFEAKDDSGQWSVLEALNRLREATKLYVEKYNEGRSSVSAFKIIAKSLQDEAHIRPFSVPDSAPSSDDEPIALTADEYRAIPAAVTQRRYKSDSRFRAAVDQLIARGEV